MRIKEQRKRKKRRRIGICIFLVVLMLFALAALIVVKVFTVQNVVVEGNSLYSADQIKNMVLDDDSEIPVCGCRGSTVCGYDGNFAG